MPGVQQPTDRQSSVSAYATVRMPSEMESQNRTEQMQQNLPEKAMVCLWVLVMMPGRRSQLQTMPV